MAKIKMDEEYGLDRAIEVGTDDEENEAETYCVSSTDDDDDVINPRSRDPLVDSNHAWPQSYRYYNNLICSKSAYTYANAIVFACIITCVCLRNPTFLAGRIEL